MSSISSKSTSTQFAKRNQSEEQELPEEVEVIEDSKPSARFTWPKVTKTKINVNGEIIPGYRFLQDTNKVDRIFVDVMHEIEPFLGKHGEKQDLWLQVENECKKQNPSLFREEFSYRNARDRLKAYESFVKRYAKTTNTIQDATTNKLQQNCFVS